jgi:hypothetical protein
MKIQNSLQLNNKQSPQEEISLLKQVVAQLQAENAALKERLAVAEGR